MLVVVSRACLVVLTHTLIIRPLRVAQEDLSGEFARDGRSRAGRPCHVPFQIHRAEVCSIRAQRLSSLTVRKKAVFISTVAFALIFSSATFSQSPEFSSPWKNPNIAIAIDPYEGNQIDWEELATDKRVVAIIHRATIGDRADKKYAERKIVARERGYKWGAYHLGKPGDPIKQADFFLRTVKPDPDDLLALDLESTDASKHMSFAEARLFIKRIKEKTRRYPFVYANNVVTKAISEEFGDDDLFAQTRLWYARFKSTVTDFPKGAWDTYTLWQFSSEINCKAEDRTSCLYTVPGTAYDMDVNVFNGTIEELKKRWPFADTQSNYTSRPNR